MEALGLIVVFLIIGFAASVATAAAAVLVSLDGESAREPLRTTRATPGILVRFAPVPPAEPQADATPAGTPPAAA